MLEKAFPHDELVESLSSPAASKNYTARIRRLPKHGLGSPQSADLVALPMSLQLHTVYGYAAVAQEGGGRVRISSRKQSLLCVCTASLALGVWGLASAQAKTRASVRPPRIPGQDENGIRMRAGVKTHGPGLHDYPQFISDRSKFLTEHGAVATGSLHPSLAQDVDSTSASAKGIAGLTLRDEGFFNMTRAGGLQATTGSSASVT